ncbi:carbohydrate sulfotransferase 1-like [Ruditapes philippinarum]|uniref:carbohydrate sulfotransferase 1-like n=1 Tax=Ruditapes philippinarum TaxID=129788 RepID=UPI00295A8A0F|nr:carbohydrate sulfotransferase 1-like [Ruditapes philippinarum]
MLRFFKRNIHAKLSGKKWNVFRECSAKNHTLDTCLRYMSSNVCSRSQNKVTKVLRISLFNLKSFLEVRPNLKIVHLFRDPRAVINSHIRTNWSPVRANSLESVASVSRSICGRMADDIENAKKLKAEFPQRFLIVQYEDFKNPLPKIRKLIDFVGMKFTSEAYNFIDIDTNATSGSKLNGNHPFLYREQLEWRFVRVINRYCSNIYKELGYTMFGSEEELKDTEIQPVTSPLPYALL